MSDKVKDALKAAASFKARGIKKAALDVVADYEAKKAAPGDEPIQRDQPATQADPATPPPAAPVPPVEQAPVAPVEEDEVEETPEETPEAKKVRWREELDGELNDDDLITAVIEFLEAEDLDLDDYGVKVKDGYFFGSANIELGKNSSYVVCKSDDDAETAALNQVRDDLNSEPENYNQDWLQGYINKERLARDLHSDVEEGIRQSPDSYGWDKDEYYETEDFETYTDSEGNVVEDPDEVPEEWIEQKAEEQLVDPVTYLTDMLGDRDGIKQAMEIGGLDIEEAAKDAVAADGWQHWLCRYDGNSYDLPSGGVYWKG